MQESVGFRAAIAYRSGAQEVAWPRYHTGDANTGPDSGPGKSDASPDTEPARKDAAEDAPDVVKDAAKDAAKDVARDTPQDAGYGAVIDSSPVGASGELVLGGLPLPSAGIYPIAVATADFDGDGKPDLVAANREAKAISVLVHSQIEGGNSGPRTRASLRHRILAGA